MYLGVAVLRIAEAAANRGSRRDRAGSPQLSAGATATPAATGVNRRDPERSAAICGDQRRSGAAASDLELRGTGW